MDQLFKKRSQRQENIFFLIDRLITLEIKCGIKFDETGLPIPEQWMYLDECPNDILPYDHRLDAKNPKTVSLCFFQKDQCLYRRLTFKKLEETAKVLAKYQGFCGFDLSIFSDMLKPFQDFYVLANMVIDIYCCLHGAKLIPNLREDEENGKSYFHIYATAPIVCSGTLGCSNKSETRKRNVEEITKYAKTHPSQTIIQYGNKLCDEPNTKFIKGYGRWRRYE